MRTYFVRVPRWLRVLYPKAIWDSFGLYEDGRVLWTFDDGPDPNSTHACLDFLDDQGATGIFFMSGEQAETYPALVTDVRSQGHAIASHGYKHLDGWRTQTKEYVSDIQRSLDLLETDLFRPPYGRMGIDQYRRINDMCRIVMWSLMPGDFDQKNTSTIEVKSRCASATRGDIVVLHDRLDCIGWMK